MPKKPQIETPRGCLYQTGRSGGGVTCRLDWALGFGPQRSEMFSSAQQFVDSEVLRRCTPYVPFQTGMLTRSGELGTVVGSGEVRYIAPYARRMYYGTHFHFDRSAHPNAGAKWFDRMLIDHRDSILRGAARLAGGDARG